MNRRAGDQAQLVPPRSLWGHGGKHACSCGGCGQSGWLPQAQDVHRAGAAGAAAMPAHAAAAGAGRAEVAGRGITRAEAARHAGISWPVAHEAFAAAADPVLERAPAPVAHLGIDEHRRGRARWRTDEQTGEYLLLADRWHLLL
jgi:hypothetical protein